MKMVKIADKIIVSMYRNFVETGDNYSYAGYFIAQFPNEPPHLIYAAIRMLDSEGLLTVSYGDDDPDNMALNVSAIQQCDENTILKKGYNFIKEIQGWL